MADEILPQPTQTTTDCRNCVSLRSQNTALANLLTDEADALHAVREYALECSERAGAQIDAATVSARLWPILAGVNLIPRPCPRCVERRLQEVRHAEFLTGLAGLQGAAG